MEGADCVHPAEDDLDAIVCPEIRGVSIGKVHTPEDVHWLSARLSELEGVRVRVLRTARERRDALRDLESGGGR